MDTERVDATLDADTDTDTRAEPVDDGDLELIEEISIDGMCGVY